MNDQEKHHVHARLSTAACEGLEAVADEARVSLTALLEALGLAYAEGTRPAERVLELAQQVDLERRRRGRRV